MGWASLSYRAPYLLGTRSDIFASSNQNARHICHRHAVIDGDVLERARGHARAYRVVWILDDRYTAMAFDLVEPGGAVVETAGQQDADHSRAVDLGGARK